MIFLDIDGVLNHHGSAMAYGTTNRFDNVCVRLMERLARQIDARFVISSAWRIGESIDTLRDIFRVRDGDQIADRIIDKTDTNGSTRGHEIGRWLTTNPAEYVIVDDDSDMLGEQTPRFVQTSFASGFGVPEYVRALELFIPKHKDVQNLRGYRRHKLKWDDAE